MNTENISLDKRAEKVQRRWAELVREFSCLGNAFRIELKLAVRQERNLIAQRVLKVLEEEEMDVVQKERIVKAIRTGREASDD